MPALRGGCAPLRPGPCHLPPPPSVTASGSLLARFGAGVTLVLSSLHLPLGHPQRPLRTRSPIPCHEPAPCMGVVMGSHREGGGRGGQAAPGTRPGERGQGRVTSMSPCRSPQRLVSEKQMPPWPGSCTPAVLPLPPPAASAAQTPPPPPPSLCRAAPPSLQPRFIGIPSAEPSACMGMCEPVHTQISTYMYPWRPAAVVLICINTLLIICAAPSAGLVVIQTHVK